MSDMEEEHSPWPTRGPPFVCKLVSTEQPSEGGTLPSASQSLEATAM